MLQDHIKEKVLKNSTRLDKFRMRDLVWNKKNAEKVISSIVSDDIGILGGDVYMIKNENLIPLTTTDTVGQTKEKTRKIFS